jgi:hypothetical protein
MKKYTVKQKKGDKLFYIFCNDILIVGMLDKVVVFKITKALNRLERRKSNQIRLANVVGKL